MVMGEGVCCMFLFVSLSRCSLSAVPPDLTVRSSALPRESFMQQPVCVAVFLVLYWVGHWGRRGGGGMGIEMGRADARAKRRSTERQTVTTVRLSWMMGGGW